MAKFDANKVRNIGIIAHIDAGKTTTTEHLLYYAGAKHKLGGVDEGTTETDWYPEEQDRGITIYSACVPLAWKGHTINLIDTPGHVDFTAEVERSLRVLDGAVVVFDAQNGVEAQSETVWRQANKYKVPRLVFINKMDVVGADFGNVVQEIRERLEGKPLPLTIPIGSGSPKDSQTPFAAIIDLLAMKAVHFSPENLGKNMKNHPIPPELEEEAKRWRDNLFEVLSEHDEKDVVTSAFLEGKEIPRDTIHHLIREQTLKGLIQPVFCGSGREHVGIQPVLDAICNYLPSPLEMPPVEGINPRHGEKKETRKPDDKEPFAGLVFKIVADIHGDLYYFRIYSGTLKANSRVWNPLRECKEFASKIYHVHADPRHRDDLPIAYAGDIVALLGPKDSITGDTLCDNQHPIILETISFAEAVVSRSIEPETSADKDKLVDTLNRLKREDPTFDWKQDPDTGQTLMTGMGLLHLEVMEHRMERDFRLKIRVGKPRVSYRETIREPVKVQGECVKQMANLFAKVTVKFEPNPAGGIKILRNVDPEKLPPNFVEAAEQGIRGALVSGELGYPVIDIQATIIGGELHEELSNEIAFQAAGTDAVHKALQDNMVLLEPMMRCEVTMPEEYLGAVTADLNARRAEITQMLQRGKLRVVVALVPLAKMFDYSDTVRSLTQGRAGWTMEPKSYAPVPKDVVEAMWGTGEV